MARTFDLGIRLWVVFVLALPGCMFRRPEYIFVDPDLDQFQHIATRIEYPDANMPVEPTAANVDEPITLAHDGPTQHWDLSLQQCVSIALQNSSILRDLGGLVLQSPGQVRTPMDPAIDETDPRFGVEAALAGFDAEFATSAFFEKNDRQVNNALFAENAFRQDLHVYQAELSKRGVSGTEMAIRHNWEYDFNNTPGNPLSRPNRDRGGPAWQSFLEAEFRQPLLKGFGVQYNRIAGVGATEGVASGVLIARINTDITLADFESGVRNLVNDIENQYWELYFAYRDLDARLQARQRALETWRRIHTLQVRGQRGGEAAQEAQAREQYFRLEQEVQDALSGRQLEKTRTIAFRGTGGIHANERRLRLLMGVPVNDGRLIRPIQDPPMSRTVFGWRETLNEALVRRAELRQQKWLIKRRELELIAAKNFLKPQLDAIGRYRFRGLGRNLLSGDRVVDLSDDPTQPVLRPGNAFRELTSGDYQEWQLGFEFSMPFGFRQGHAAVRNAELLLARERTVLAEQEREIAHDLSNAVAEKDRAYAVAMTNYNRRLAAKQQLEALEVKYTDADDNQRTRLLDLILDSQRRLADSESGYFRGLVEHAMAIKRVHFEKGSLLDYNEVLLSEGPWPGQAYYDAARRTELRGEPLELRNYMISLPPPIVTQGKYSQQVEMPPVAGFDHGPLTEPPPVSDQVPSSEQLPPGRPLSPRNQPAGVLPPRAGAIP